MERLDEIIKKADYCLSCKAKPCIKGCPLQNDITDFIKYIKEKEYKQAYEKLCETTVLQAICGRICPHEKQCQGNCIRGIKGEPVSIGDLEAFIGDMAILENWKIPKNINKEYLNKKIAIIGGGPAGLTSAAFLAKNGVQVTIYEKYEKLGGILYRGIPDFRLDKSILEDAINKILESGIKVEYCKELGKDYTLDDLKNQYDAIILAFGANISSNLGVDGEELDGVYGGNELLEKQNYPDFTNKVVAVIGGGNVAMDASRTINRLGAKKTYVIYRRSEEQMPAETKEIMAAKKEGIEFLFLNNIVKIIGNKENKVEKIECIKTKLVEKEKSERPVPVDIEGSNYILNVDYVIKAVGSKADKNILEKLDLELNEWGNIKVDENYLTSKKNVYAIGDIIGTKSTVAWAAMSGKNVAKQILKNL